HQSIRGAAAVAASIQAQRPELPIFPVPTRLENAEFKKLNNTMTFAKRTFAPLLWHIAGPQSSQNDTSKISDVHNAYWADVQTPYRTFYAFEEVPAAFNDAPDVYDTILASMQRLAKRLSSGGVPRLNPSNLGDAKQFAEVVASYELKQDEAP